MPEPESEIEIRAIQTRFRELMDLWFAGEEVPGWIEDEGEEIDE